VTQCRHIITDGRRTFLFLDAGGDAEENTWWAEWPSRAGSSAWGEAGVATTAAESALKEPWNGDARSDPGEAPLVLVTWGESWSFVQRDLEVSE